ncbi:7099_t:CDS:2 [Diversispora eburnea]|uniref:7099_t:CDS:1 n=1 Tax=Diversispora eburnea TaxID=1213867 RepID=A0A9N8Z9T1_9GLOM|nr:7099_t:CDS:2 [Diversispora eburnea]
MSLEYLANTLINLLDRKNIFPPQLNNPEHLLSVPYKRINPPTRPPNGFLICRKNVHHEAKSKGQTNMRVISKVSGFLWRNATLEEKEIYEELANQVSLLYSQKYHGQGQPPNPYNYTYYHPYYYYPYPYASHRHNENIFYHSNQNNNYTNSSDTMFAEMTRYYIDVINNTGIGEALAFCVYQKMPSTPFSDSVSWLITSISSGAVSTLSWNLDKYLVALAEYSQKRGQGGTYVNKKLAMASLGTSWQIRDNIEDDSQLLIPLPDTVNSNIIKIINKSSRPTDCGIGMWGGTTIFERNLRPESAAVFKIEPEYWIGVFAKEIRRNQVVDDSIALDSMKIQFPNSGFNVAAVTAIYKDEKVILKVNYTRRKLPFLIKCLWNLAMTTFKTIFISPFVTTYNCFKSMFKPPFAKKVHVD